MWPWKLQLTFMIWRLYLILSSKGSLIRFGLLDHILCEWQLARHYLRLVRHYFEWVWVILGGWGVDGALFWVGGVRWGCMGHYFGWVGVGGKTFWVSGHEWGRVHSLIMPYTMSILNKLRLSNWNVCNIISS